MKAKNPRDGVTYYFVDKCLPFGASISCAIFQAFSDALSHIVQFRTGYENINYLDDYFFADCAKEFCDKQIQTFLDVCQEINFPVSIEKTEWASTKLTFLGLTIDTVRRIITIPADKIEKAVNLVGKMLIARKNKTTLRELQKLCGFLNFIGKCIVPGRAFTRRLYSHGSGILKPHHHINLNAEFKLDLRMWSIFLKHPTVFARPFFEFDKEIYSTDINLYTDSAKRAGLGCGGYHYESWFIAQWEDEFLEVANPSINYLELFAVTVAVVLWIHEYKNKQVTIFCDNMSVVHMINNNSSKCKNCMVLIRILVLHCMIENVKVSAKHVSGKLNIYADLISRMKYKEFRKTARMNNVKFASKPTPLPEILWPIEKLWIS